MSLSSPDDVEESFEDLRVELARRRSEDLDGAARVEARAVRPVARQGLEDIGDGDNPRHERDLLAAPSLRVASPLVALVVVGRPEDDLLRKAEALQKPPPDRGVLLHESPPRGVKPLRALEQGKGHSKLSDVVQEARLPVELHRPGRKPERPRQVPHEESNPQAVGSAHHVGSPQNVKKDPFKLHAQCLLPWNSCTNGAKGATVRKPYGGWSLGPELT